MFNDSRNMLILLCYESYSLLSGGTNRGITCWCCVLSNKDKPYIAHVFWQRKNVLALCKLSHTQQPFTEVSVRGQHSNGSCMYACVMRCRLYLSVCDFSVKIWRFSHFMVFLFSHFNRYNRCNDFIVLVSYF